MQKQKINPVQSRYIEKIVRRRTAALTNRLGANGKIRLDVTANNWGGFTATARTIDRRRPIVCHADARDPAKAIQIATEHLQRKVIEIKNRRKHGRHEIPQDFADEGMRERLAHLSTVR